MPMPAARVGDMHACPMVTVLVPHVGGPIIPPAGRTNRKGGMPASRMLDPVICVGAPDFIAIGYPKVLIGGMPAARMLDMTMHGGTIACCYPPVLIG